MAKCKCAGHCYTSLHRTQGCKRQVVLKGSDRCVDCTCELCLCPRHHSDLCFKHKRILDNLPLEARLVREARHSAERLIPADIQDFLTRVSTLGAQMDLALTVLLALIKEPVSCAAFLDALKDPLNATAEDYMFALEQMLLTDPLAVDVGLRQLNRQGVGRFFGPATTCRVFGIIRVTKESEDCPPLKRKATEHDLASLQGKQPKGATNASPSTRKLDQAETNRPRQRETARRPQQKRKAKRSQRGTRKSQQK